MYKIFEILHLDNEKEWVCARTNIEALNHYINTTECGLYDLREAQIIEIPEEKWGEYKIKDSDKKLNITFKQWMKENGTSCDIIAGTMYGV